MIIGFIIGAIISITGLILGWREGAAFARKLRGHRNSAKIVIEEDASSMKTRPQKIQLIHFNHTPRPLDSESGLQELYGSRDRRDSSEIAIKQGSSSFMQTYNTAEW